MAAFDPLDAAGISEVIGGAAGLRRTPDIRFRDACL